MIYNVPVDAFGPLGTRNGDLIAICNIIEWMRKEKNDPSIQFYLPHILNNEDYIRKFYDFLCYHTDYLTNQKGDRTLEFHNIGVWDFRDIIGDHVLIHNNRGPKQKKVVIFPVYDAQYNGQRNWTDEIMNVILDEVKQKYPNHRKIICCRDVPPDGVTDFEISTDFLVNIEHIMESSVFYGGDTGVSHFASALDNGPELNYIYSSRCLIHTLPFYFLSQRKGNLRTYWLDFVGNARWKI